MINTTIKYVVYTHSGGGVRHHHFGVQNNIINEADGTASSGDSINALGFSSLPFMGVNLPFAFMSVHGAADGNHLYTTPGNQTVPVGNDNIDILVVYAPVGGIGSSSGGPGVWVDAFNVDTGNFSDSDFIQVLTPPTPPDTLDNPKTHEANVEGDVSSVTVENLRAYQTVDGASFLKWKKIIPIESYVTTRDFTLAQNESGEIWFAFYQTITIDPGPWNLGETIRDDFRNLREEVDFNLVPKWTEDDWCGTRPPGPHHRVNFQISIPSDILKTLSSAQKQKLEGYIKEYPAIANAAYSGMTKVSAILKGVGDILSEIGRPARANRK